MFKSIFVLPFLFEITKNTKQALEKASGFIRGEISKRVDIRHTPELRFIYDKSEEYGNKIDNLIKEIHEKDNN
jgi:ribosome-binding factor A